MMREIAVVESVKEGNRWMKCERATMMLGAGEVDKNRRVD